MPDQGAGSSNSLLARTNPIFFQERSAPATRNFLGRITKKPLARSIGKILYHHSNMRGQLSESEIRENTVFCQSASPTSQSEAKHGIWGSSVTLSSDAALNPDFSAFHPITFVCHSSPKLLVFYLTRAWISDNRHPLPKNIDSQRVAKLASCKPLM